MIVKNNLEFSFNCLKRYVESEQFKKDGKYIGQLQRVFEIISNEGKISEE